MFDWYKHTEEMACKVKKTEFVFWAREFKTISSKQIDTFLCEIDEELSFHEMKCKFSEKYQDRITFSYFLGVENKIVKDLHIKKITGDSNGCSYSNFDNVDGSGNCYGDGYGDHCGEIPDYGDDAPFYVSELKPGFGCGEDYSSMFGEGDCCGPINYGYHHNNSSGRGDGVVFRYQDIVYTNKQFISSYGSIISKYGSRHFVSDNNSDYGYGYGDGYNKDFFKGDGSGFSPKPKKWLW